MKKKEEKDIELKCEEVQEILTRPPHALVRWGITVFFGVLTLLFIGGCFFKYPDIVSAEITITTEHPPVWIVARGSGKIQEVYRKDRETIKAGDIIAVLVNPAITVHVLELKER
ncbi:MAG: HlyD family secretion protein, partial [Bacteroides intestinalis]|nr:HlyD family secretion protein [Bacteroides intestinalis]